MRVGERAVSSGVEQLQHGVDRVLKASMDRLGPVRRAREEMSSLRERLEELESSLEALERERGTAGGARDATRGRRAPARRVRRRGRRQPAGDRQGAANEQVPQRRP